jgi:hypothetical protein
MIKVRISAAKIAIYLFNSKLLCLARLATRNYLEKNIIVYTFAQ